MHLTTVGRKSGRDREVIIGYLEDGPNLVAIAMNGWDEGHPAWWLNLQAHPEATVRLARQDPLVVRAQEAAGEERDRLWRRWVETDPELTAPASHRATVTPVVVFEPAPSSAFWFNIRRFSASHAPLTCSGVFTRDQASPDSPTTLAACQ